MFHVYFTPWMWTQELKPESRCSSSFTQCFIGSNILGFTSQIVALEMCKAFQQIYGSGISVRWYVLLYLFADIHLRQSVTTNGNQKRNVLNSWKSNNVTVFTLFKVIEGFKVFINIINCLRTTFYTQQTF